MRTINEKIARELNKAKTIWRALVNNQEPQEKRIFNTFTQYKFFLDENKDLFSISHIYSSELEYVENLLISFQEYTSPRDKKNVLNDAYVGLIMCLAESMEELQERMEEETVFEMA